jgi:hypothetical protein
MTESEKGKSEAGRVVVRVAAGDSFHGLGALRAQSDDRSFGGANSIRPQPKPAPSPSPKDTQDQGKPPASPPKDAPENQ